MIGTLVEGLPSASDCTPKNAIFPGCSWNEHPAIILKISAIFQPLQYDQTAYIIAITIRFSIFQRSVQNHNPLIELFGIIFQLATYLISSRHVPSRRSPSSIPMSSILDVKQFDYTYISSKTKIQNTFLVDLSLRLHFRILSKLQIEPN
jgi:hypothetical protein